MKTTGFILVIIGAIMMIYTGFNYVTTEKIVEIGPIEISKEKKNPVNWSPILGGVLLLGGIILISKHSKK
ncbi:hypothetical protein [Flavobacterium faecale]|uniref:hypothetical protein n=1 Tax=Flavobacterium faecale TaxID=1355330 RepID=UPI003AAF6AE7